MPNPRLADRYAKSLMDLAIEQGKTDAVYSDMQGFRDLCRGSRDLVALMKSPIVKADAKLGVLRALLEGKCDGLTLAFMNLIVHKGREAFLPEIASACIAQYKKLRNINEVKLTTAAPLDADMEALIRRNVEAQFPGMSVEIETAVKESLLGGFVLESNNNTFDASVLRDLNDIKKQFLKNEYIPSI